MPNIFDKIVSSSYFGKDTANFVVVDKSEYDLVLGSVWLMHTGYAVDRHQNPPIYINKPKEIEEQEREKRQYRYRKNLWELPLSLHTSLIRIFCVISRLLLYDRKISGSSVRSCATYYFFLHIMKRKNIC